MPVALPKWQAKVERFTRGPASLIRKLNGFHDAILELRGVVLSDRIVPGRNLRESQVRDGRLLDGAAGGGAGAEPPPAWEPYTVPGVRRYRLRPSIVSAPGPVANQRPSNWTAEFEVPATCAEGFFIWLAASWNDTVGMMALTYESGLTVPPSPPGNTTTGQAPPRAYLPLVMFTSLNGVVDPPVRIVRSPVTLRPYVADATCAGRQRHLGWFTLAGTELDPS